MFSSNMRQAVKSSGRSKLVQALFVGAGLAVAVSEPAFAASLISAEQITSATTDAVDTAEALGQGFLLIAAGITVAMALPGMLKRALGKSGVR